MRSDNQNQGKQSFVNIISSYKLIARRGDIDVFLTRDQFRTATQFCDKKKNVLRFDVVEDQLYIYTNPGNMNASVMIVPIKNDQRKKAENDRVLKICDTHLPKDATELDSDQMNGIIRGDIGVN
jgi:hypothetical protein